MNMVLTNWKTTVAGVVVLLVGVVAPLFGVNVPGFHMDVGTALVTGYGLIVAKDFNVSGK